jgi:integrase
MICNVFKHKRLVNGKRKTSRLWSGRYRQPGEAKIVVVPLGVSDKQVALEKLKQLVQEGEREAVGLIAPKKLRESAQKALKAHVVDFIENLRAIGRDEKYVREFDKRLAVLIRECEWKSVKDVTPDSFQAWRSKQEKRGKTLNEYLNCASGLMNWMERNERILRNPLKHVGRVESSVDPSFKRRASSIEELRKLMAVAGPRKAGYLTAALTGMRRAELEKLQWRDVHLEAEEPFLNVRGSTTKNAKQFAISLHDDVIKALRELRPVDVDPTAKVFAGLIPRMDRYRKDLAAAGIPYNDARGGRADFHALRMTFQMNLTLNGALPRVTQELLRHSDMKLTTKTYTDAGKLPTTKAVRDLPSLDESKAEYTQIGTQELVRNGLEKSANVPTETLADHAGSRIDTGFEPHLTADVLTSPQGGNRARCRVRTGNGGSDLECRACFDLQEREEVLEEDPDRFFDRRGFGADDDFRIFGGFVGGVDAGELLDAAGAGFLVEVFRVARLANMEGGADEDLDEIAAAFDGDLAGATPVEPVGGDEGGDDDDAAVGHEFRDFGDAADVFDAVLGGEAEVRVEAVPDVVAVEDVSVDGAVEEFAFELAGEGGFAGARESGEPDDHAFVAVPPGTLPRGHVALGPGDVRALYARRWTGHFERRLVRRIAVRAGMPRP